MGVAVFFCGLCFVQALQSAIVALVQAPAVGHGHPVALHFFQRQPQGANGAAQNTGKSHVKFVAFCFEQAASFAGLGFARGGQIHIGPAGKTVFQIPGGLAVANQDKFVHD